MADDTSNICTPFLLLLLAAGSIQYVSCFDQENLKIPDPFTMDGEIGVQHQRGYYAIESYQVTNSHRHSARIDVSEYFSFKTGVSYSIQTNKDDTSTNRILIIVDSYTNESYIIRDYDPKKTLSGQIDCQVDHLHSNRVTFPWHYRYAGNKEQAESFIYGVGAIWMNAIKRQQDLRSDQTHPTKNSWIMRERDIEVELMFDKPSSENKDYSKTRLESVQVTKTHAIHTDDKQNTYAVGTEKKQIFVSSFEYITNVDSSKYISKMVTSVLTRCRLQAKDHYEFPNLLSAVSSSPQRMFYIDYMLTKYPAAKDLASGTYDNRRHRHVFDHEYRTEFFSFQKEMSSFTYVSAEDNADHPVTQADTFIKKFTDTVMSQSTRKPTSVTYHLVEDDNKLSACYSYQDEPEPVEPYMVRPVHFYTRRRSKIVGQLAGLGALIMNAADSHHNHMEFYWQQIDAIRDPENMETTRVDVNEWQIHDKHTKRIISFFFKQTNTIRRVSKEISDLVRVDIRDRESNLLYRYDIFELTTEVSHMELEHAFDLPQECFVNKPDHYDSDSESESEHKDPAIYDDSDTEDDSDNSDEDEDDFEFDPGNLVEHMNFPKFYEYLDGRAAYELESEISVMADKFYLKERVDIESEETILIVSSASLNTNQQPLVEFHVNYNSDLIFRIIRDECELMDKIDKPEWLKLISTKAKYFKSLSSSDDELIESDKLPLFGVGALWRHASESEYTSYDGFTTIEENGVKYNEMKWTLKNLEEGSHSGIVFVFRYDLAQHLKNIELKIPNKSVDLTTLNRIEFRNLDQGIAPFIFLAISLKSIEYPESAHVEPIKWKMPAICNPAIDEASKKIADEHHEEDVTIPSLLSFVKQQRAYTMQYTVSHTSLGGPHYLSSATSLPITESFDLESHKGKLVIGIGLDRQIVYVDGAEPSTPKIYAYFEHKNECKRLGTLNNLVDLGNQFKIDGGGGNDQLTLYGLGALWNRLAKAQNGLLKIEFRIDERGFKREIRTYRVVFSHVESYYHITEFLVLMVFAEDVSQAGPPAKQQGRAKEFKLESIDVVPKKVRGKDSGGRKRNHRTTISVASFVPSVVAEDWILPEVCEKQTQQTNTQFPKLSDLIRAKRQFKMRSEMTSDRGTKRMLTLVEEWIYEHNYRYKTLNMGKNYDQLIYGSSRESFDFMYPYQCSMDLWKSNERRKLNQDERKMVLDLWSSNNDESTLSLRPSLLNFAPAALWMAAERNPSEQLKLVSSMDLAPLPTRASAADRSKQVEREMRMVVWQVSSPPSERSAWSYRLTFEQVSAQQSDGKLREWHILDKIELEDTDSSTQKFYIELDVVNYSYELSTKDIDERFSIPEASGCARSESVMKTLLDARDELQFRPSYQHKIAYEASLELMGTSYAPISGQLYSTGRNLGDTIQVFSHHMLSRNLNGSTRSSKTVYDRFSSIIYTIDTLSGICEIRREKQYDWQLRFEPLSGESSNSSLPDLLKIKIDDSLFELLFLNTAQLNFKPVNRWTTNGWHVSTYELSLNNIKLFKHLPQGQPATIVRRFLTYGAEPKLVTFGNAKIYRHNHLDTTVYLFSDDRDKVVGKLMIGLDTVLGVSLAEIFKANTIEECYSNKQVSSFAFEYKLEAPKLLDWLRSNHQSSEREFLLKLLRRGSLLPTQIVGTPRISQQHREDLLLVDFQLLDAPTSVEYYRRQLQANMMDELIIHSQMRLLPDLEHCSRWCDKEDCLAMSYCSGRVCRILTEPELRTAGIVSQVSEKIMQTVHDEACDYFYSGGFRPSSLSKFSELVQSDVARVPASSVFSLDLADQSVLPSEFYEQVPAHDSHMDRNELDEEPKQKSYMVLEQHDLELDLDQLKKSLATVIFAHTDKLVQCLDECSKLDCELVSHDPISSSCAIVKGKDEIRNLLLTKQGERKGLTIALRDHRDEYSRFEDTALPKSHKEKLDDYSAIECASACSSRKLGCLSFDHCRPVEGSSSSGAICFLQEAHLLSESFDRSLLEPNFESSKQEFVCEHYSRSKLTTETTEKEEDAEVEQYDWSTSSSGSTDIKLLTEKIHKLVKHVKSPQIFMSSLFYIMVAICIGSLLQVALIRLTGRSILFAY